MFGGTYCGTETTITRNEACDHALSRDSLTALEIALQARGWLRDEKDNHLCPTCSEDYFY